VHPLLYEINTRCWLTELSRRAGRRVTLAEVPAAEFAQWRRWGVTHVWLMGVWTTGPRARAEALNSADLRRAYAEVLPGWTAEDVGGSPYSIAAYSVPAVLGGDEGLAAFRAELHRLGMKLILDFVPNHLGLDHPWLRERSELFVQAGGAQSGVFVQPTATGQRWIANGKDPYFPAWTDVAQLDYRRADTRAAMSELLGQVAERCDGVRCDMAMLLLNDVFARTWAHLPSTEPPAAGEFWEAAIRVVKQAHPGFLFLAEVYWDLEAGMQSLGFDYTYDKHLYDDLVWLRGAAAQHRLLQLRPQFTAACAHFLENHDELRIATRLDLSAHRAAALAVLGMPGMRFLHEGQLCGAKQKLPVQLTRGPVESPQATVSAMYEQLLGVLQHSAVGRGTGQILTPRAAWPENPTGQNFILVFWPAPPPAFELVVVNYASHRSQCYVPLPVAGMADRNWTARDLLGAEIYPRAGSDLADQGFYLDVPAFAAQLFRFEPAD
jgi:hypothetical protein